MLLKAWSIGHTIKTRLTDNAFFKNLAHKSIKPCELLRMQLLKIDFLLS